MELAEITQPIFFVAVTAVLLVLSLLLRRSIHRNSETPGEAGRQRVQDALGLGPVRPGNGDWIFIREGGEEAIGRAVDAAVGQWQEEGGTVREHSAGLWRHRDGFFILRFEPPLTPNDFVTLVNWLDAPVDIAGVSGAVGWLTSPKDAPRYPIVPDYANSAGDTVVGLSSDGRSIRVNLATGEMCPISEAVAGLREPDISEANLTLLRRWPVRIEDAKEPINPGFIITHGLDHQW